MYNKIKKHLPEYILSVVKPIYLILKRRKIRKNFLSNYKSDMNRYLEFSRTLNNNSSIKSIGSIILQYHVIEKGLTMPETRLGFGKDRIMTLCKSCIDYVKEYGLDDIQIRHAIGVLYEYEEYHNQINFQLDDDVFRSLDQLKGAVNYSIYKTTQIQTNKVDYFSKLYNPFKDFSNSRKSIRNFSSEEIPISKIQQSISLAHNTPSACNRQCWRTYVYTDKERLTSILNLQGGSKGFSHLADKLIIVTGELGVFCNANERNQVYIDGGMFAMNLLYGLHSNEIAACVLNCSFEYNKEQEIKSECRIKNSEVLIVMIACGIAPDQFKIALSPRYSHDITSKIIS